MIAGIFHRYGGKYEENYGSKSGLIARIFLFSATLPLVFDHARKKVCLSFMKNTPFSVPLKIKAFCIGSHITTLSCQQIAKEMPAKSCKINANSQKVGSDNEPLRGRLQPSRKTERDFYEKEGQWSG